MYIEDPNWPGLQFRQLPITAWSAHGAAYYPDRILRRYLGQPTTAGLPQVMFEFDVHYGFRSVVNQKLGQVVPSGRLTKHDEKHDFVNVKLDLARLEIGTERFTLDAQGLANIAQVKKNIAAFADALEKGCRTATERRDIKIPGITGHPRLFPLPNARTATSGLLVHKLHINGKFPSKSNCLVWASPQAHITIPLAKVAQLIDEIRKSIGKPPGKALSGGKDLGMGMRSEHLFKAKAISQPRSSPSSSGASDFGPWARNTGARSSTRLSI